MNEKTKAHFVEQMRKTQENFNALMLMFAKHVDEEWEQMRKTQENFNALMLMFAKHVDEEWVQPEESQTIPMENVPQPRDDGVTSVKEGFPIKCSSCGKHDTVPFKPQYASKVYCSECFKNRNGNR